MRSVTHFAGSFTAGAILALAQGSAFAAPLAQSYVISKVSLPANDLAYNSATGEYLASVSSTAGFGLGNSITRLSATGQIIQSTFVGSEPGVVALSSDGTTGYVALLGSPSVRQFDAVTGQAGIQIGMGSSNWNGPAYAEDISVAPGQNDTIAVSRRNSCCSPRHEGVAIYKNGVLLPNATPGHTGSNTIEFGADASTLYGYNNETSDFGFRTMSVDAFGVSTTSVTKSIYGYGPTISYDGGLIFSSNGSVVDPKTGLQLGTFNISYGSVFASAAAWGQAYALSSAGVLTVYDLATFTPITTYALGGQLGGNSLSELVVGGNGNLAVRSGGNVFFLSAVPEASTTAMWALALCGIGAQVRRHRQQQTAAKAEAAQGA